MDACLNITSVHRGPFGASPMSAPLRAEAAQWLRDRGMSLRPRGAPLGVCIMTADYWGLKTAGGTATAYHLLAQVLPLCSSLMAIAAESPEWWP